MSREYAEKAEAPANRKITVRGKPWTGPARAAKDMARRMRQEARLEAAERKLGLK